MGVPEQKLQLGRPKAFVEAAVAKAIAAGGGAKSGAKGGAKGAKGVPKGEGGLDFAGFEELMVHLGGDKDTEATWAAVCSKTLKPIEEAAAAALNQTALSSPTDPFNEFLTGSGDVNVYVTQTIPKKVGACTLIPMHTHTFESRAHLFFFFFFKNILVNRNSGHFCWRRNVRVEKRQGSC